MLSPKLTGLDQVFPEVQVPEILQMCLVAMGVPNVEEVSKSVATRKTELANQAVFFARPPFPCWPRGSPICLHSLAGVRGLASAINKTRKPTVSFCDFHR